MVADLGAVFAHPLTEPFSLPVSPLVLGNALAALVLVVAFVLPRAGHRSTDRREREVASWAGSLSATQVAARCGAVALLGLAIAAGRLGVDDELENLAPALVVGALWPLVVAASILLGPVWRWIDPWDAIARALVRGGDRRVPGHVWPAVAVAFAWAWFLSVYARPLDPRSVGAALTVYTLLTVAGCLAVGRIRWLASSELFGILLSWMALARGGRLADWTPPRGATALLGVLAGGVLFGAVRRSELWGGLNTVRHPELAATAGLVVSCAAVAALLTLAGPPLARHAVARAAVPAVAGVIVAVAMDRNRLTTSVQLLPGLLGDPFGSGWDLLGRAGEGLVAEPLGVTGLLVAQLGVLTAGFLGGAVVLAGRPGGRATTPVAVGLAVLAAASVIAVTAH